MDRVTSKLFGGPSRQSHYQEYLGMMRHAADTDQNA
jgi:hypothetical protein